jgi:hypothetical protein
MFTSIEQVKEVIYTLSIKSKVFDGCYTGSAKNHAQNSLNGISHYFEESTIRFFKAKIVKTSVLFDGLVFVSIESSALNFDNTKRGYRFAAFDCFGNVIQKADIEQARASISAANSDLKKWLDSFDVLEYYSLKLHAMKYRLEVDAKNIGSALGR